MTYQRAKVQARAIALDILPDMEARSQEPEVRMAAAYTFSIRLTSKLYRSVTAALDQLVVAVGLKIAA
jgi:hypothetical protein